jgi:hypothetical protein
MQRGDVTIHILQVHPVNVHMLHTKIWDVNMQHAVEVSLNQVCKRT